MSRDAQAPFRCGEDVEVPPGEKRRFRYPVGETYMGDPVEIPVTVVNGEGSGPTVCLTAAAHGDELNGVKVLQVAADRYDPADLNGTLVCLHVLNVPGFHAQERYIPIYDQDLNRSFPGRARSNTAERMADRIYRGFVARADLLVDFHTSTRNRTNMYHVRADTGTEAVDRLARAYGANVVISGTGEAGSLRTVATNDGVPAITVEMGKAHRFQPPLIETALVGVENVLAAYDLRPEATVVSPGWRRVVSDDGGKAWLRADEGGLVDMRWGPDPLVYEGDPVCTISDHFRTEECVVRAPFTGLVVGVLENPVALPGHPLCHLVRVDDETRREIEAEIESGEFDESRTWGYRRPATGPELD